MSCRPCTLLLSIYSGRHTVKVMNRNDFQNKHTLDSMLGKIHFKATDRLATKYAWSNVVSVSHQLGDACCSGLATAEAATMTSC